MISSRVGKLCSFHATKIALETINKLMRWRSSSTFREELVNATRKRVAEGFYDDPERMGRIADRIAESALRDLDSVPVGRGKQYCEAVCNSLVCACDGAVDPERTRVDFPNRGARGDIEMPLKLEQFDKLPLLSLWANRYGMQSIVVEVKNLRKPAAVEDAKQLVGDLAVAQRGRVGLLVARTGFTRAALRYMTELARLNQFLVLPCDHERIRSLVRLRAQGIKPVMSALCSIQVELLQAA